jgi:ribonuclease D
VTLTRAAAPRLITRPADLQQLASLLSREPRLAVDTESNSLYAYREQVCLVQFSTPRTDYLVDPLTIKDLSPLGPLFSDRRIEKVFHAAEYDIICLKRDFNFRFENLFDTMVAARILGREAIGLGSLLEEEFGVRLDKRFQRANWGRRPMPPEQLEYARYDTHYLLPLRDLLKAELEEKGLWPLAVEDFTRMCQVNGRTLEAEDEKDAMWRIKGAYDLPPQQAAVLRLLCTYRGQVARSLNRPLFKVMGDQTLLAIAAACPASVDELRAIPGMSYGQLERHADQLLSLVRRGLRSEPLHPPQNPRPDERYLERLEALRQWRKKAAEAMGVKSDIVLPRDLLHLLAEQNPTNRETLSRLMHSVPWRLATFGDQILAVLDRH